MRACHYQTVSVETRQAVHMAPSQQLSAEDPHIQSATVSGTEKLAFSADSNGITLGCMREWWESGRRRSGDVLDTSVKQHQLSLSLDGSGFMQNGAESQMLCFDSLLSGDHLVTLKYTFRPFIFFFLFLLRVHLSEIKGRGGGAHL